MDDRVKVSKIKKLQGPGHMCRKEDNMWTCKVVHWVISETRKPKAKPFTKRSNVNVKVLQRSWKLKPHGRNERKHLEEIVSYIGMIQEDVLVTMMII